MSHQTLVLEPGDTKYVGVLKPDGEYVEVRLSNVNGSLLVTTPEGSRTW